MAIDDRHRIGASGLRVTAWRGRPDVALLSPSPDLIGPGAQALRDQIAELARRGVDRVITSALQAHETPPFTEAGFVTHETLHLLRHDLRQIPPPRAAVRLRRGWRSDHRPVLTLDSRAFDDFWALDRAGLHDARKATILSRFRVSFDASGKVDGYAITGRSQGRGYLQRLAVDPDRHRRGIGQSLLADSLQWLVGNGARSAVVNTQRHNHAAVALYEAAGFVHEPTGLTVMRLDLEPDP